MPKNYLKKNLMGLNKAKSRINLTVSPKIVIYYPNFPMQKKLLKFSIIKKHILFKAQNKKINKR